MDRWEYFTTVLEADVKIAPLPIQDAVDPARLPKYSVYTLMPQLNSFGEQGCGCMVDHKLPWSEDRENPSRASNHIFELWPSGQA